MTKIRPPIAPPADAASPLAGNAPGAKIGIIIETAKKKRKKYFEAVRGTSAEDAD